MAISHTARTGLHLPFSIRFEQRLDAPNWLPAVTAIGSLVVAFAIGAVVIWSAGGDAIASYGHLVKAAFGDIGVFNDTLVKASPLILIGLACTLAFRMKL